MNGKNRRHLNLSNKIFCLSIDVELSVISPSNRSTIARPHPEVSKARISELMVGLDGIGAKATFAVCGHLMLESCSGHPDHPDQSILLNDPISDIKSDPGWYARDLVESIKNADHEIACHSFSHISFQDPRCSAEVANYEIKESNRVSRNLGINPTTFVFPRHEEAHHHLLTKHGYNAFVGEKEGKDPQKFEMPCLEHEMLRIPRTLYLTRSGLLNQVKTNLKSLILGRSGFFHLWLHDWNLAEKGMVKSVIRALKFAKGIGYEITSISELAGDINYVSV